jgi:tetraacyldisaccharide 4'-kinase
VNLLESLYYWGYSRKKRRVLREQNRLPHPVISIGNITMGGTGKTPAAIAVAEEAQRRGYYPVILTRGYRGRAKGPCLVGKGPGSGVQDPGIYHDPSYLTPHALPAPCPLTLDPSLFGDEPVLMAERLRDVPVIKAPDRYAGGLLALDLLHPSSPKRHSSGRQFLFILDDGFQHWALYRDIDIVLIDGINPFGNRRLLPLGPLRGPLTELREADIFVVTKQRNETLGVELKVVNPYAPVFYSDYRVGVVRDRAGNEISPDALKSKKVFAFCGIGNPESFRQTVLSLAGELCGFMAYRDHHQYREKDLLLLGREAGKQGCDILMTTEKDMVKIRGLETVMNIVYPEIDFIIDPAFFDELFQSM